MQTSTSSISYNPQINQLLLDMAEEEGKTIEEIMFESLRCYSEIIQRKKLQQQIKNASYAVREQSLEINQSLEASNADGL